MLAPPPSNAEASRSGRQWHVGLRVSHTVGRAARAQLPPLRPSGVRLDRAGAAARRAQRLARRAGPSARRCSLALPAGLRRLVYFVGTIYWTGTVVRQFGGLAPPVALFAMLLLAAYLALFPALTALITARLVNRAGAGGAAAAAGGVGGDRVPARVPVRRLSLGAARQQPGHGAAGGAAGQRARRLRAVGAGGVRERRASRARCCTGGRQRIDGDRGDGRACWPRWAAGAPGGSPTAR